MLVMPTVGVGRLYCESIPGPYWEVQDESLMPHREMSKYCFPRRLELYSGNLAHPWPKARVVVAILPGLKNISLGLRLEGVPAEMGKTCNASGAEGLEWLPWFSAG